MSDKEGPDDGSLQMGVDDVDLVFATDNGYGRENAGAEFVIGQGDNRSVNRDGPPVRAQGEDGMLDHPIRGRLHDVLDDKGCTTITDMVNHMQDSDRHVRQFTFLAAGCADCASN